MAAALFAFTGSTEAAHPHSPAVGCAHAVTAKQGVGLAVAVWSPKRWKRGVPKPATIAAHIRQIRCAAGPGHRRAIKRSWNIRRRRFYRHRHAIRERLRYLPFDCGSTRSAIPCYIMLCESRGSYTARNPTSTAGGRYQILDSTWYAYGGKSYASPYPAAVAPPAEQDRVAAAIYADVGPSAWACA